MKDFVCLLVMHHQAEFELDPLMYWKPVKRTQCLCDMISAVEFQHNSRGCVEDPGEWLQCGLREASQYCIAAIESGQDHCHSTGFGRVLVKAAMNLTKSAKMEKAGSGNLCDVGLHVEATI